MQLDPRYHLSPVHILFLSITNKYFWLSAKKLMAIDTDHLLAYHWSTASSCRATVALSACCLCSSPRRGCPIRRWRRRTPPSPDGRPCPDCSVSRSRKRRSSGPGRALLDALVAVPSWRCRSPICKPPASVRRRLCGRCPLRIRPDIGGSRPDEQKKTKMKKKLINTTNTNRRRRINADQ